MLLDGVEVLLDPEDEARVAEKYWHRAGPNRRYLMHNTRKNGPLYLHRFILEAPPHLEVDHINRDTFDNRKCNLRLATHSQNHANIGLTRVNTSGFKGVSRKRKKWRARITVDQREQHLGVFDTPEDAAAAYREAAVRIFGEFARF